MSDFKEIGMNTLPVPEGYVGNLSDEHKDKLYEMWRAYFVACDDAKGDKKQGGGEMEFSEESDPTKLGIPQDDAAKEEAKKRMEEQGMRDLLSQYGSEALRDTYWSFCKADNPDTTMLRFLRARKWDVSRAMAMLATCLKWRLDSGVEDLARAGDYGNFQSIPKFSEQQNTGKIFAQGATANEAPICYVRLKKHFTFGQPASTMLKFIIFQMETWRLFMVPPQDKMTILFDLDGFGVRNCDVVALLNVVKCLEAYFPESLEKMFIHRAPWIFSQIWKMIKGLLDPVVRNKIAFTSNVQGLNETIPSDRLLEWVKGSVTNDFVWMEPTAEENALLKDTAERDRRWDRHRALADEFEKLTRRWSVDGGKDPTLNEQREILVKKLRLSQFELEPYTRGRTIHHRNGTLPLANPGMVKWDYIQKDGEKLRQIIGHKESRKSMIYELLAIQDGASVDDAEAKTKQMIEAGQWGQWDTCDDMPDNVKNQVEHLLTPATSAPGGTAAAQSNGTAAQSNGTAASDAAAAPAAVAPAAAAPKSNGIGASPQANGTANGTTNGTANGASQKPAPAAPAATNAAPKSNGPSDYKSSDYSADYSNDTPKKQSMFGSLKKKIMT